MVAASRCCLRLGQCHVTLCGSSHDTCYVHMSMEFVVGGDLLTLHPEDGRFDATRTMFYAAQVTAAIEHIHSRGVVYRGLELSNILVHGDGSRS